MGQTAVSPALETFHPAVREWFLGSFAGPTEAQQRAWAEIAAGRNTLVLAPTGSGKTLAAFLAAIDRLMFGAPPAGKLSRCRVVYISPLRALAVDVERNLRAPLAGIARVAARRGDAVHAPEIAIRTGDTPADERARMARRPADVLITTPESLFLMLTSNARETLDSVEVVIVDEIHAMVATKRGAHLALSLERLAERTRVPPQRIGLSATQRPLEEVARYLGGGEPEGDAWRPRPVAIVDAGRRKAFELKVEVPVEDMARLGEAVAEPAPGPEAEFQPPPRRSIWPAIHPRLLELVRAHRSTLIFVNSRRLAERLAAALNELADEPIARAHHGSIAREERLEMEDALKAGRLPALVATSSLELGIDMGAIDLVVQIETPPSVASGVQRIGRAGHQVEAVSRGILFPKYRGDLLAAATLTRAVMEGRVEATRIPQNPLDVLAQQLAAACALDERRVDDLHDLVRRAAPWSGLSRAQLEGVLDMLAGRYPSEEFAELRPRLTWDRVRGTVRAREGTRRLVVVNAGTIPDRGLYGVFLAEPEAGIGSGGRRVARRVGELDEEMVFESREGEVFVLGATSWRILEIDRDRVIVAPAPGEPGKMPFWKADRGARPVEMGRALGQLTRELAAAPRAEAHRRLVGDHGLDEKAAHNLLEYLADQQEATGALPDDRTIVLERSRDEMGDWRLCLLSPWGGKVHAPWAMALKASLEARGEAEVETVWSDDGIVIRLPERDSAPDAAALLPEPEEIEELVVNALGGTALFAAAFREAAGRALLLPRRRPGQRKPLWMQRKRAADLLGVASRYPSFPIVLETYREVLKDVFDLPGLVDLASRVRRREVRLATVDVQTPSPFSSSLLFGYVANYLYEGDAPLAERRAQALQVDQAQLRELLGESELRELLDPEALADLEETLQCLGGTHRARSADRVHDLLLRLGDLSEDEVRARCDPGDAAPDWLASLETERRAIRVGIAGEERWAAVEDAGRLRDGLGVVPPSGLPAPFLEPVSHALVGLIGRFARTHGPFRAGEAAARFGLGAAPVESALAELAAAGRVLEGEFRPGGSGREWCDAGVLGALRRRSLAKLRREVEPAAPEALARLALDWQGVGGRSARRGPDGLLDVVEQLQGVALAASTLESAVLPARLPDYRASDLDTLCAAGEVVWVGLAPLGSRDGRVALYLSDHLGLLRRPPPASERPRGALHDALRAHLDAAGASFFHDLHAAAGGGMVKPVVDALWDLVWAGEVTNDSPEALRAFLRSAGTRAGRRGPARPGAFRSRRQAPAAAVGRWTLLGEPTGPEPARRGLALAEQLLARHGVLTREALRGEELEGGFAAVYPALKAMEEAGRSRRGYFVAGLGGLQFAHPGAIERLRGLRETAARDDGEPPAVVLAATDPASPWGAALPWPAAEGPGPRPMRTAGAHVVLVDGRLAAFLTRDARDLRAFLPDDEPLRSQVGRGLARALAAWSARTGRRVVASAPTGAPPSRGPLAPFLVEAGFEAFGPGFRVAGGGAA